MMTQGGMDGRQKVVWEKRGRGRWVNLPPLPCMCAASVIPQYEWVWELGQVGEG